MEKCELTSLTKHSKSTCGVLESQLRATHVSTNCFKACNALGMPILNNVSKSCVFVQSSLSACSSVQAKLTAESLHSWYFLNLNLAK